MPAVAQAITVPLPKSSQPTRLPGRRVTTTAPTSANETTTSETISNTIQLSTGFAIWAIPIATRTEAATSQTSAARHPVSRALEPLA